MADLGGTGGDRATLTGFLDWNRALVPNKLAGLSFDDAARPVGPSQLSMLGIVQHLGWAERLWFRWRFADEDEESGVDLGDRDFTLAPDATIESVFTAYDDAVGAAQRITAAADLDVRAVHPSDIFGIVNLRWILGHMIEETARHLGHLDVMRELTDGRTGD